MMIQDEIFLQYEGSAWYNRNKDKLGQHFDMPIHLINSLAHDFKPTSILELGCADGWRLNKLNEIYHCHCVGVDASSEAIAAGSEQYPNIILQQGLISETKLEKSFSTVIVNFVLHWVSRKTLLKSIAEIDRLVIDGGLLVIGDFMPDFPQKRNYHHVPGNLVHTFKQDYAGIFVASGLYKEIARQTYNHDDPVHQKIMSDSSSRAGCVVLRKDLNNYYHLMP